MTLFQEQNMRLSDRPEKTSYVFNIQHYSLHDGPGIRTIIFLKGCPMRCRWCCNPESQRYGQELSYVENKCIGEKACGFCARMCREGVSFQSGDSDHAVLDMARCSGELRLASVCPAKAIKVEGMEYTAEKLLDIVERDAVFYGHGDGGMTISGGEPLTHPEMLDRLLSGAKRRRIHTAIETCGQADYSALHEAAKNLDYILFDIKSMNTEKHREYTGWGNERILDNFARLCEDYPELPKKVRTPIIPDFNDSTDDVKQILEFIKDKPNTDYEPLPYHSFGRGKYNALGKQYEMGDAVLDKQRMDDIFELCRGYKN